MIMQPGLVFAKSVSDAIAKDPTTLEAIADSKLQLPEIEKLESEENGELLGLNRPPKVEPRI